MILESLFLLPSFRITCIFSYPYLVCLRIMMKLPRIAHLSQTMETAWAYRSYHGR